MTTSSNPWTYFGPAITIVAGVIAWQHTTQWDNIALVVLSVALVCAVFHLWASARLSRVNYGQQVQAIVVADWGQKGRRIRDDIPENLSGVVFHFVPARMVQKTVEDIKAKLTDAGNPYHLKPHGPKERKLPVEVFYFRDPKTGNVNETQAEYETNLFAAAGRINQKWLAYIRKNSPDREYVGLFFATHRNGSAL